MSLKWQRYTAAACEIGARLCREAIWWESCCNWLGSAVGPINTRSIVERTCGPEFYSGTSGIALFLARLYALTGEKPYRTAAIGAINQAWSKRAKFPPGRRAAFYTGLLGVAYARILLAECVGDDTGSLPALREIESMSCNELEAPGLDVMSGSAGVIPVLLQLHRQFAKDWLLELAVRHGERLLDAAHKRDEGWSWKTLELNMRDHLTGFSHGAAGIAWALLELYQATGGKHWRRAADEGFRYERLWFDGRQRNWADLRVFDEPTAHLTTPPPCSTAWCHGAPGIALSRLRAWEILRDDIYRQEAETALASTAKALEGPGISGNFSLCHGLAGNAEGFLLASQVLDSRFADTAEAIADRGIQHVQSPRVSWPCGVKGGGETANLMLGLAGIGYFYLRVSAPDQIPSVLIVHPRSKPTAASSLRPHSSKTAPKTRRPSAAHPP